MFQINKKLRMFIYLINVLYMLTFQDTEHEDYWRKAWVFWCNGE